MKEKKWWQSKTLWSNLLLGVAAFFPSVQAFLSPEIIAGIFAGVNALLRIFGTDSALIA